MVIGIIGPLDSCKAIINVLNTYFPKIEGKIYEVSQTEEAYLLISEAEKRCDGIILTGLGVYYKTVEKLDISIPNTYVPFLTSSIMKAFWTLNEKYPDFKKISIDVVKEDELENVIEEFKLKERVKIFLMEYNHLCSEKEYLEFHIKNHKKHPDCVSIIALGWVYEEMKKKGYNVIRMYPTKSTIKRTIKDLTNKINQEIAKDSNLAIQVLYLKNEGEVSQYRKLQKSALIEKNLSGYIREIQGSMFTVNWDRYIIFSTKGAVENEENLSLLKNTLDYLEEEKINIFVGTGLGKTSKESELNAKKALGSAIDYGKNSVFKVEDGKIEGPMLCDKSLTYNYIVSEEMNIVSEKSGVNVNHIEKIKSIEVKYDINTFTSQTLAEYLDVSTRTANRIINRLSESGYAKEIAQEVSKTVGRPKKIIEINF